MAMASRESCVRLKLFLTLCEYNANVSPKPKPCAIARMCHKVRLANQSIRVLKDKIPKKKKKNIERIINIAREMMTLARTEYDIKLNARTPQRSSQSFFIV